MLQPAPLQTTYQQYETAGQPGMSGSMVPWSIDNRILEDPTGNGVGFGFAVCQGYKSDKGCTLGQLSGGAFVGITHADVTLPLSSSLPAIDTFYDTDNVPVQTLGDIWVTPETTVAAGSPVYFNSVTGGLGDSGVSNAVLIENAIWITSLPNLGQPTINFNGLAICRLGSMA